MPSLPEARPWWRVNVRALRALLAQLPGYARWLGEMQALRTYWRARSGTGAPEWEEWLSLAEPSAISNQPSAINH
jgi:hypothetical protein